MKSLNLNTITSLLSLAVAGPLMAAPSVSLGDNLALFFSGSAGVEYQTNVGKSSSNEQSDTIYTVDPGIELKYGGEGSVSAVLKAGWLFREYSDASNLDGDYPHVSFVSAFDNGITNIKVDISYIVIGSSTPTEDAANNLVPALSDRVEFKASTFLKNRVSGTFEVGAGFDYWVRGYNRVDDPATGLRKDTYNDIERYGVPVRIYKEIAEGMDAYIGYRYRKTEVHPAKDNPVAITDFTDHYYHAGLEGQLFNPLFRGEVNVGYQERDAESSATKKDDDLSFNGRLSYARDENQNYFINFERDYATSPSGGQTFNKNTITVGGRLLWTETVSTTTAVAFANADYVSSNREDDLFLFIMRLTYSPNEYVSIEGSYRYTDLDSSQSNLDYDNHIFGVSASLRY